MSVQERKEALARLRQWVQPGDTIHTICRRRSPSGMSGAYSFLSIPARDNGVILHLTYNIAKALGKRCTIKSGHDTIQAHYACNVVEDLSLALFGASNLLTPCAL